MSSKMELSKVNMNEVIICDRLVFVKSTKKKMKTPRWEEGLM